MKALKIFAGVWLFLFWLVLVVACGGVIFGIDSADDDAPTRPVEVNTVEVETPSTTITNSTTTTTTTAPDMTWQERRRVAFMAPGNWDPLKEAIIDLDNVQNVVQLNWNLDLNAVEVIIESPHSDITSHNEGAYITLVELADLWDPGEWFAPNGQANAEPQSLKFQYWYLPDGDSNDNGVTWTCTAETMIAIADKTAEGDTYALVYAVLDEAELGRSDIEAICK